MGPELAVADGALGFWQALEEVWTPRLLEFRDRFFEPSIGKAFCSAQPLVRKK
jgi:hypothetical protein